MVARRDDNSGAARPGRGSGCSEGEGGGGLLPSLAITSVSHSRALEGLVRERAAFLTWSHDVHSDCSVISVTLCYALPRIRCGYSVEVFFPHLMAQRI